MKTQHTPGPWALSFICDEEIANIHSGSKCLLGFTIRPDDEEKRANARLIASAPELLEALEGILADVETANEKRTAADWDFACYHAANQARAAINAAKGEA